VRQSLQDVTTRSLSQRYGVRSVHCLLLLTYLVLPTCFGAESGELPAPTYFYDADSADARLQPRFDAPLVAPDDLFGSQRWPDNSTSVIGKYNSARPRRFNDSQVFRLRGRIDVDSIEPFQSAANQSTFGDLPNEFAFRRARIGAEGKLSSKSRYIGEIDLASGNVVLRDLYFGLGSVKDRGEIKLGHMREPFSLEGGTSANTFAFAERSPINTLDPARNWGVGFVRYSSATDSTLAAGIFQSGTDPSDVQFGITSDTALTGRVTKLVWNEDNGTHLMHFGLALSERFADYGIIAVNQRPRSPLLELGDSSESPFVPKITIPASFQQLVNLQWALVHGSAWMQAEFYCTIVAQHGGPPVFYHGSYVNVGYFLTGEHRKYLTETGVFGPVIVNRPVLSRFSSTDHIAEKGGGAWELTARISYLDFVDSNAPVAVQGQPVGTLLPQTTLGVNWYLADRLRIMFNYTLTTPFEVNTGWSTAGGFWTRLGMFW
jgi:phosphate-selective porin OprO/OprP